MQKFQIIQKYLLFNTSRYPTHIHVTVSIWVFLCRPHVLRDPHRAPTMSLSRQPISSPEYYLGSSAWCQVSAMDICGVIKQNQSEVGQIHFSVFYIPVCTIFTATFCRKSHWNWSVGSKDMSSWRMPKTIGNKRHFRLCLALS